MSLALVQPESPTPPQPKKSLSEIFNTFAADATERFPHLKGKFLVADMNERKVYGHKEIDTKKTGLTPLSAREYIRDHEVTQEMAKNKEASSCALHDPKQNVSVVFINEPLTKEEAENVSEEAEKHLLFVLDHELAHCGVKDGFGRASSPLDYRILLGESVADAYAMIRHYQRYGVDSEPQNKYIGTGARANHFILGGDSVHFTSFVLDALIKRKHDIDFDKLSPEQTAELARRFALQYMPPERVVQDLQWTFEPIRKKFASKDAKGQIQRDPNGGVQALIEKALDPASDYYTYKMASMWLKPLLEERKHFDGKPIDLPREYLDNAQAKIREKDAQFAKEDILFNMPVKPPKQKPFTPKLVA
jgi:hypothetical protein